MKKISGLMIYYYFVCKAKLWYFNRNLNFENQSELVEIGRLIDESSYGKKRKHIQLDETINIDFMEDWKILHEVKKSKSIEEASIWQVKYYMKYLMDKGIEIEKGIIDYPKLRVREEILLSEKDIEYLEKIKEEILEIISSPKVPEKLDIKICKNCAYYEFCRI